MADNIFATRHFDPCTCGMKKMNFSVIKDIRILDFQTVLTLTQSLVVYRRVPSPMPNRHWTVRTDFVQFDHRPIRPTSSFFFLNHFFWIFQSFQNSTFPKKLNRPNVFLGNSSPNLRLLSHVMLKIEILSVAETQNERLKMRSSSEKQKIEPNELSGS